MFHIDYDQSGVWGVFSKHFIDFQVMGFVFDTGGIPAQNLFFGVDLKKLKFLKEKRSKLTFLNMAYIFSW